MEIKLSNAIEAGCCDECGAGQRTGTPADNERGNLTITVIELGRIIVKLCDSCKHKLSRIGVASFAKPHRLRELQREVMPQDMINYEYARQNRRLPDPNKLLKRDFICECLRVLSEQFIQDKLNAEPVIDKAMRYTKSEIYEATSWVNSHFAELDLGGNMAWHSAFFSVLVLIKKDQRDADSEYELLDGYLKTTRWYVPTNKASKIHGMDS